MKELSGSVQATESESYMLINCKRAISREVYERSQENNGFITDQDKKSMFSPCELYGYGIYTARGYEEDGKYFCRYLTSDSCD